MTEKEEPIIKSRYRGQDFTKITLYPDLQKFGIQKMSKDFTLLIKKRAYDLAGILPSKVKIFLNGE